jgi:phage baseplate assembly protein W
MPDLFHEWQGDLRLGPAGDLRITGTAEFSRQRVLRRLLTNVGDYVWSLNYGAGLGSLVGRPIDAGVLVGLVREQLAYENAVSASPPPQVSVLPAHESSGGTVTLTIKYYDQDGDNLSNLTVPIGT